MLLSDRRKFLGLLAVLPLAACGFRPVYKAGSAARAIHGALEFNLIDSREGFALLEALENRLGAGGPNAPYAVTIDLMIEEEDLVLTVATGLVRYTLDGIAKVKVIERASGEEVFSDKLRDEVSYSGNEETLVTNTSKRDAHDKLIRALADQIVLRLSSTAESWAR